LKLTVSKLTTKRVPAPEPKGALANEVPTPPNKLIPWAIVPVPALLMFSL
jgi:hypothetical protein